MKTIKTISIQNVATIPLKDLRPGMIVAEGIVLDVDLSNMMYYTVSSACAALPRVEVYAKITDQMVEILKDVHREAQENMNPRLRDQPEFHKVN